MQGYRDPAWPHLLAGIGNWTLSGRAPHFRSARYDGAGGLRVRIVSIGEILWDVIGPTEYLGGAPLNFAAHAHKLGHEVALVSGVGDDERGHRALHDLQQCGVSAEFVQLRRGQRTGTAEVELGPDGKPMFRIVRPAAYDFVNLTRPQVRVLWSGSRNGFTLARSITPRNGRWIPPCSCWRKYRQPSAFTM
jgi:hypothetical protein